MIVVVVVVAVLILAEPSRWCLRLRLWRLLVAVATMAIVVVVVVIVVVVLVVRGVVAVVIAIVTVLVLVVIVAIAGILLVVIVVVVVVGVVVVVVLAMLMAVVAIPILELLLRLEVVLRRRPVMILRFIFPPGMFFLRRSSLMMRFFLLLLLLFAGNPPTRGREIVAGRRWWCPRLSRGRSRAILLVVVDLQKSVAFPDLDYGLELCRLVLVVVLLFGVWDGGFVVGLDESACRMDAGGLFRPGPEGCRGFVEFGPLKFLFLGFRWGGDVFGPVSLRVAVGAFGQDVVVAAVAGPAHGNTSEDPGGVHGNLVRVEIIFIVF